MNDAKLLFIKGRDFVRFENQLLTSENMSFQLLSIAVVFSLVIPLTLAGFERYCPSDADFGVREGICGSQLSNAVRDACRITNRREF